MRCRAPTTCRRFTFETRNVPCRTNPLGVKGAGEAGAIGSCPAVMNAILDALWRAYRIRHVDMPATPERRLGRDRGRAAAAHAVTRNTPAPVTGCPHPEESPAIGPSRLAH